MCLVAKRGEYFIAKEDIICYKAVYLYRNKRWTSVFSYNDKLFEFNKVLAETTGKPKQHKIYVGETMVKSYVELKEGYFHSCQEKKDAYTCLHSGMASRRYVGLPAKRKNFAVCKCTIPKGTVYYKDCFKSEYASRK